MNPQNTDPMPQKSSGKTAYPALCSEVRWWCSCKYVGSHVREKYQENETKKYCRLSSSTERERKSEPQGTAWDSIMVCSDSSSNLRSAAFAAGCSSGRSRYHRANRIAQTTPRLPK